MPKFARAPSGVVIEPPLLWNDFTPSKAFPAEIAAEYILCPDEVEQGWTFDGENWAAPVDPEPVVDLDAVKASLFTKIDAAAEAERVKYITPGAGQAMTYQQKASEAVMLEDDPDPEPAAYPLLSAEVGITAPTLAEVGALVRQAHAQWLFIGAAIEAARLGAKRSVAEAATAEDAWAVANVTWPA